MKITYIIEIVQNRIHIVNKQFFADVPHFLSSDAFGRLRNELILLKGARPFGFDRITEQLEQKVHETILEVNLNLASFLA